MKYIHGRNIPGRASGSSIVRIVFGSVLLLAYLIIMISSVAASARSMSAAVSSTALSVFVMTTLTLGAGGVLLLLFGIRALRSSLKEIPMRDPNKNEAIDPLNPFFTVSCPSCTTKFDYQRSDLGFRAWYPNGYVVCPDCGANIRHNAAVNVYETFGEDVYIYPNN